MDVATTAMPSGMYRIATIVWGVSVLSVVSLNGVGTVLAFGQEYQPMVFLVVVLNVVGCATAGLSLLVPKMVRSAYLARPGTATTTGRMLIVLTVVRVSLAESAGLMAFVATFVAGPVPGGVFALMASLAALAAAYPTLAGWHRFETEFSSARAGVPPIVSG